MAIDALPKGSGIYVIRNLVNSKAYVGSALCVRKRIGQHLRLLRRGGHHSIKLQRAWDKHGEDAFSFGVLARVEAHALVQQEQAWIDFLDTAKYGYNMTATAGSLLGFKHTTETRQRMRAAKVGVPKSPAHVAAVAAALKGRVVPLAERQKMRAAKLGKPRGPMPAEQRAKIAAGNKGKPKSPEHIAALALAQLGMKQSPETIAKRMASTRRTLALKRNTQPAA